jgi:hypothetical protein
MGIEGPCRDLDLGSRSSTGHDELMYDLYARSKWGYQCRTATRGMSAITSSSHCSATSPVPVESWELLGIFTLTRQAAVTFGIFRTQPGGGIWTISCLML